MNSDEIEFKENSGPEPLWNIDDFEIGKKLGFGKFGRVFLAREKRTKFEYLFAIKILKKKMLLKTESTENFKRECDIHLKLDHPNIVKMHTWFHDDRQIYLVLELAVNGNLYDRIQKGRLDDVEAATYIHQTTQALMYIHSLNIIHRDLKPENILIGCWGEVKLADFGWANIFDSNDDYKKCTSLAGTLDYLCPEMILKSGHTSKVDNWCLGVLCYESLAGQAPFHALKDEDTIENILKTSYKIPTFVNRLARNFISKLLVKNPEKRIELEEVLTDSWVQSYADNSAEYMKYYAKQN